MQNKFFKAIKQLPLFHKSRPEKDVKASSIDVEPKRSRSPGTTTKPFALELDLRAQFFKLRNCDSSSHNNHTDEAANSFKSSCDASGTDTVDAIEDICPSHTEPCERGGLTMVKLASAMKQDAEGQEELVDLISELLVATVDVNDQKRRRTELKLFEGPKLPITVTRFVHRIMKYGNCSPCALVVALIYLERLKRDDSSICLTSNNFQRLFLVSLLLAAKFLDDLHHTNKRYSEIGGFSCAELNMLEVEMLFLLGFDLHVKRHEYDWFCAQIYSDDVNQARQVLEAAQRREQREYRALTPAGTIF